MTKKAVGSFFMVAELSKNVDHHVWPMTKIKKKKHGLKRPKEVLPSQKKVLFYYFYYLKYYFGHIIFLYLSTLSTRSSGHDQNFLKIFTFFSRKSDSQQKLVNKITYFILQLLSGNPIHFMNLNVNLKEMEDNIHKIVKTLFHFTHFPANTSRNVTVPFLDAQELHSWSTLKANVCIFLYISVRKFVFHRSSKILSGDGMGDGVGLVPQ